MRQASQYGINQDEQSSPGEERLRQLVRLRTQRGRVLTTDDEDKLLEEAVTRPVRVKLVVASSSRGLPIFVS